MASLTRQVLNYFEQTEEAISLNALAKQLDITRGTLEGILNYWVRKGKLREITVDKNVCNTCGVQNGCPFITALPRYYEVVTTEKIKAGTTCSCDGQCE